MKRNSSLNYTSLVGKSVIFKSHDFAYELYEVRVLACTGTAIKFEYSSGAARWIELAHFKDTVFDILKKPTNKSKAHRR